MGFFGYVANSTSTTPDWRIVIDADTGLLSSTNSIKVKSVMITGTYDGSQGAHL
jgi:hypothetical protein